MSFAEEHRVTVYYLQIEPPADGPDAKAFCENKRWKWVVVDTAIQTYAESEGFFANLGEAQKDAEAYLQELGQGGTEPLEDEKSRSGYSPISSGFSLN